MKTGTVYEVSEKTPVLEKPANYRGRIGLFTTYCHYPRGVHLEDERKGEEVILFMRQHIIFTLPWLIIGIVLLLAPSVLFPLFMTVLPLPFTLPLSYIVIGTLFWYLATFGFILGNFLIWTFNIFIVTSNRVIDIDFKYLLYKESSESELDKVQDISFVAKGILETVFSFGTVLIQTASEIPNIEFERIPNPQKVTKIISDLVAEKP